MVLPPLELLTTPTGMLSSAATEARSATAVNHDVAEKPLTFMADARAQAMAEHWHQL